MLRWLYFPWAWLVFMPVMALATLVFGSLSFLLTFVSVPLAHRIPPIWGWILCRANFVFVKVKGRENVRPGQSYVVMSNHQSHFDVPVLSAYLGMQYRWVAKKELESVPVMGPACKALGHIFIDRKNRESAIASLNAARPRLVNGVSVLFFPEGTRSRDGRMKEFKKGGFVMALDLGLPILPVSVSGTHRVLPGKSLKLLPGCATVTIHPAIDVAGKTLDDRDLLMEATRRAIGAGLTEWERGEV